MSCVLARDNPEKHLPALVRLRRYAQEHRTIVDMLESLSASKSQEFDKIGPEIQRFMDVAASAIRQADSVVEFHTERINSEAQRIKNDRNEKKFSNGRCNSEAIFPRNESQEIDLSLEKTESLSPKQKRQNKFIQQISSNKTKVGSSALGLHKIENAFLKLQRNPSVCQIIVRSMCPLRDLRARQSRVFYFCHECSLLINKRYNGLATMKRHYYECHDDQQVSNIDLRQYSISQGLQLLAKELNKKHPVFYRCNCRLGVFANAKKYMEHIIKAHQGYPPPFSSHIFQNDDLQTLIENPDFNQRLIVQDMLYEDIYYCGECQQRFYNESVDFYSHMMEKHQGNATHHLTSHFVKKASSMQVRLFSQWAKEIVQTWRIKAKGTNQLKLRERGLLTAQDPDRKVQKHQNQAEKLIKQIVSTYDFQMKCQSCNKLYNSYEDLRNHIQSLGNHSIYWHLNDSKNQEWIIVALKSRISKHKYSTSVYCLKNKLPEGHPARRFTLDVPLPVEDSKYRFQVTRMTYDQFLSYVTTKTNKRGNNNYFAWFCQNDNRAQS